jgi:SAM-dependent methyltransferase
MSIEVNRPEPIAVDSQLETFANDSDINQIIETLESGKQVVVKKLYSNGLELLSTVQRHIAATMPNKTFLEQREYRSKYHRLSNLILIEISNHKLKVKKAPSIGWLEKLYSETGNFYLTFPQVQGLNSAWQWYENGIQIPVLRNKIHPYYGTYFPTRFDHLILFDNWLKRYEGPKKTAIDVGVGSGILSFQLIKHGFQKVFATDINPNAIVGLTEFMGDTKLSRKLELDFAPLFGKWEKPSELIVFNPPWLPQPKKTGGNEPAIYYDEKLFPEFFAEAKKRLLPDGKLVILFSNLGQITNATKEHPIENEIDNGGRFKLEICLNRGVKAASDKTKRDQHWRSTEEVELWVLTH